jgi:hypothetical protein
MSAAEEAPYEQEQEEEEQKQVEEVSEEPLSPHSSAAYDVTAFTTEDEAWLKSAQNSKLLDPLIRVVGVGHRHHRTGRPTVLVCYPLRVAHDPSRADVRGFSKNKWRSKKGAKPVPWPNTFWLVCPETAGKVGQLEHQGLIQKYHARFVTPAVAAARAGGEAAAVAGSGGDDEEGGAAVAGCSSSSSSSYSPEDAATFARQHDEYGRFRWSLLSPEVRLGQTHNDFASSCILAKEQRNQS